MAAELRLLPYPQQLELKEGRLACGPPELETDGEPSATERLALQCLQRALPAAGPPMRVRLGSVEEGFRSRWLDAEERAFLASAATSPEAYLLEVDAGRATVVGKGRQGMLYGAQTLVQLARRAGAHLPRLRICDWPDMAWRCLSPSMTWYSGWNRLEGYDLNNWTLEEWKWLVDWSLEHKFNGWALCLYGYWPFTLDDYPEAALAVDSFFWSTVTGEKTPYRFVHRNIEREFLPELIAYARERGIKIHAYIGKNSFNGGYLLHHPEANGGGAAELLPFAPGVAEYWDAFIGRLLELGFDGFVLEDPEAYHAPNQNDGCYRTFWEPWSQTYGFHSQQETDANQPPLGVHVEYYTWLFRQFDVAIRRHAERLGRKPEVYLISHFLLSRILNEGGTPEQVKAWLDLVDEKQGCRVIYIINEADEARYTALLGGDRVASLGGRGGSCLCAWRRMTGVNNNAVPGPMGASVDWERDCQRRIHAAGGLGAMAYVFEWRSNEIYGYIGSQHLWRAAGVPGIDNQDQTGFLNYAYRLHYGDEVGALVAQALDTSPCVNEAMVLEEVHGAQYPETGRALHRDYQLLAAQGDQALELARKAYRQWTGREPDLECPAYEQDTYRWDGTPEADHLFKEEALRWLCVELRRAQLLCECALAHRRAARRLAEAATYTEVAALLTQAVAQAEENQRLYHLNFDDDYHWNEGLCITLTDRLRALRDELVTGGEAQLGAPLFIPWEKMTDILPASPQARQPGLYLSVHLGLNQIRDSTCHGVVFTVQQETRDGWQTIFRRALGKNSCHWEGWDIPLGIGDRGLGGGDRKGIVRLRLLADSYSRAQHREAVSWQWALWGRPQVVRVAEDGTWATVCDLTEQLEQARPFVLLDRDGSEHPFDGERMDSSGAEFGLVEPGPISRLRQAEPERWQWVEGFDGAVPASAPHSGPYRHFLGVAPSWWAYAEEQGVVSWSTAPIGKRRPTAVVFIGGTDYVPGQAELWCNGRQLLSFDTGRSADARWQKEGVELRYFHSADIRDERTPYGLSGVFALLLPAELVTPGEPLRLEVRMAAGGHAWFMLHGYADSLRAAERIVPPEPAMPAICAFPPRRADDFGVVVAEFEVR